MYAAAEAKGVMLQEGMWTRHANHVVPSINHHASPSQLPCIPLGYWQVTLTSTADSTSGMHDYDSHEGMPWLLVGVFELTPVRHGAYGGHHRLVVGHAMPSSLPHAMPSSLPHAMPSSLPHTPLTLHQVFPCDGTRSEHCGGWHHWRGGRGPERLL